MNPEVDVFAQPWAGIAFAVFWAMSTPEPRGPWRQDGTALFKK